MANKYIEHVVEVMEEDELITIIRKVIAHPEYRANDYTTMIKDISNGAFKLSTKQKDVLKTHLKFNSKLWY